ncbi:MAG: hypothetical protein Ct9H300mP12_10290 [Acidimicrobiales bacterium]|nr:MAG: hypothetical protein Ct9H300mP12_10290 [Acidimicrobiales bacterium]
MTATSPPLILIHGIALCSFRRDSFAHQTPIDPDSEKLS